jgi:hypothetical protein
MEEFITISRKWNNPKISIIISNKEISLSIKMDDFITALKSEIGKVTWVFTKKEFEKRIDESIKTIIEAVNNETLKVM